MNLSGNEYQKRRAIEHIASSRHPEATGVKEIKPVLMGEGAPKTWLVILTTAKEFFFITTLVTADDLRNHTEEGSQ